MPIVLVAVLLLFLVACATPEKEWGTISGFRIVLEPGVDKPPPGVAQVIETINASIPPGGRSLSVGSITFHPAPFVCGGMKVWGCSQNDLVRAIVQVATAETAADSALVEELGHFVWEPLCGNCEDWSSSDPNPRNPAFWQWIQDTRDAAKAAISSP